MSEAASSVLRAEDDPVAPHLESESRRGRESVRVLIVATVRAADVAEALDIAWQVFHWAASADTADWDMAAAVVEVQSETRHS